MDVMNLVKKARAGDREARNRVVEENVGLVWNIVKRFLGRGYEADDIFQIGCIGLIKAIDHFDLQYHVKFSTYAVPMITGEIKRFLRDDGMIKVSRTLKENGWKIKKAKEKLNQKLGRDATLEELAAEAELQPEDVVLALEANIDVDSIDQSISSENGKERCLLDQIAKENDTEKLIDHIFVEDLLKKLGTKERQLIKYRYYEDMTQTQIAKKMGISQVQVSRMEKKILLQLRKDL